MARDDMEMSLLGAEDQAGAEGQTKQKKQKKQKKPKDYGAAPDETNYVPFDWVKIVKSKRYIPVWILVVVVIVLTVLIAVYQERVVNAMRPISERIRALPAGWLIPIVILFILSFPPLIGDEIVEILCGVIYGLWVGFGIVAAGTYFGQIGCWFLFKYALRSRAFKLERTNLNYGAMARMVRGGGLLLLCVIRLSVIPPPMSTAVFSTCDVKFWHFLLSTLLCLPRQIFLVYLGTMIVREQEANNTASTIVFAVVLAITLGLGIYLWRKMKAIKIVLLEEQEQRRRAKLAMTEGRDEEEGIEHEWSSSTNDLRNDGPSGAYDPVPPPYAPVSLGENASYYNRTGNEIPTNEYSSRRYD